MPDQLSLALQAFPTVDKEKETLKYLISRINQQKGSFRNVSEQSLEEEIQAQEAGNPNENERVLETVEEVEDVKSKQEVVAKAREDIIKQIGQAYNESAQALDFVSLLLSKNAPAAAQTTLSPFLKQTLPLGSLGGEVIQTPQISEMEKQNQQMASIGWRMQSLNSAADSLLKSASRLEEEMARETNYWDQVLAVKEKGWSLSRLPREKHTLGVRYGFAEAYADFRDRGLAALRRDVDGNISLDRGLRSSGDQTLRVRILRQGKPIASSTTSGEDTWAVDDSVTKEILKARNSIFDEELHHELHREARRLINQGVRCIGGSVLLPYKKDEQIEIDLVSLADEEDLEAPESESTIADGIALSLRILLSHAHRQNLHRRSQIPPPLRDTKPPRPIYALLKPVIEYLQHQSNTTSLEHFLNNLHEILSSAALPFSFNGPTSPYNFAAISTTSVDKKPKPSTIEETLLQTLTSPLHSTMTLHLPTPNATAKIEIHTTLLSPHHSTIYTLTLNLPNPSPSLLSTFPTPTTLTTLSSLTAQIIHLTTQCILQHTLAAFPTWRAHGPSLFRSQRKKSEKGNGHGQGMSSERAAVSLSEEKLGLRCSSGGLGMGMGMGMGMEGEWNWYTDVGGGGERERERRGFDEVFRVEVDGR